MVERRKKEAAKIGQVKLEPSSNKPHALKILVQTSNFCERDDNYCQNLKTFAEASYISTIYAVDFLLARNRIIFPMDVLKKYVEND